MGRFAVFQNLCGQTRMVWRLNQLYGNIGWNRTEAANPSLRNMSISATGKGHRGQSGRAGRIEWDANAGKRLWYIISVTKLVNKSNVEMVGVTHL